MENAAKRFVCKSAANQSRAYNLLKHPNIRYTEDGGAAPYDYTAAGNALEDLPGAPENYELLDMDDFLPAEAVEMRPTIQRIRRST